MIKKRYFAVAGLLILAVAAAGCGKKSENQQQTAQVTPTPATEDTTPTPTVELVDMEKTEEKNIMGEKTSTASKLTIINQTGSEIKAIYIRQTPSEDADEDAQYEWGDDLVSGMFTLKNGDSAVYYYEKDSSSATYDIRITYTDEEKNECFFRQLPLTTIQKITLKMDGKDEDAIPYATYATSSGGSEVSTLNDVKKRLGLDTDEDSDSDSATPTPEPDNSNNSDSEPDPTATPDPSDPGNNNNNNNDNPGNGGTNTNTEPTDSTIEAAKGYIGKSVDDLIGAVGDAQSSEWDNDETTGTSGYYYYPNFTVATTVDESGNEVVSGVW